MSENSAEIVAANLSSWSAVACEPLGEMMQRRLIRTPLLTVLRVSFRAGAELAHHQHPHEQVTWLESGRLRLEIDQQEVILSPGDVLRIPPDVPHFTRALEDSSTIEIFSPAREDLPATPGTFLGASPSCSSADSIA